VAKKVLIADDSGTIRQAFEMTFAGDSGVEVLGAGDLASAMATAREQAPDLVIADSRLGSETGYDLCRQLKGADQASPVRVWIMTGPAERIDEDLYASCGADGHVRKPWDTQRMIDKVSAMSAPLDEEMSRPSYPPAARPAAPRPAAPAPKPVAPVQQKPPVPYAPKPAMPVMKPPDKRPRQATLMGGPVAPPIKPAAPKPAAPAVEMDAQDMAMPAARAALDGLSSEQREVVMALVREVVEKTVWEVVPDMAEALIREEISRLLKE
jgi:CheY-like chemotaxis protein